MNNKNDKVIWFLRILISALFLLSAFAKLYPTPMYGITKVFEQGQLIPMGFSEGLAPFVSRFIIALELFLAIAILIPHLVKRIIVPISFIMISIFSIHLSFQLFGDSENCGCFGDLIPMTPLEALLKNIVTLFILFYIYKKMEMKKGSMSVLTILFLTILTLMFAFLPVSNQSKNIEGSFISYVENEEFVNLEEDKILCFFDPDCDHCQKAARSLDSLSLLFENFPSIHIVFSDIDNDTIISDDMQLRIDNFFDLSGNEYSYQSLPQYNYDTDEVDSYMEITFPDYDNPVVILYDGNRQIRLYEGITKNEFNPEDLKMILENR